MIIALAGPSGAGKTTLGEYIKDNLKINELISHTTRLPRQTEQEGKDYYFITKEDFDKLERIEETLYSGNYYCLSKIEIENKLKNNGIVFVISDFHGIECLKKVYPNEIKVVYITISQEKMRERMLKRGDSEAKINERIENAVKNGELNNYDKADYVIENNNLEDSRRQILDIFKSIQKEEKSKRLEQHLKFIVEVDKMKNIFRQSYIASGDRHENDAEHSWHLAIMAMLMKEYFPEDTDVFQVIKMVLIHDLVEIYAGDTFLYDEKANESKPQREQEAADKLFGMLPRVQADEFMNLWHEFEAKQTNESKMAGTIDRLHPVLLNYTTDGKAWKEHGVSISQVRKKNAYLFEAPEVIADYVKNMFDDSIKKGYIKGE